jgi:hypothetical protein
LSIAFHAADDSRAGSLTKRDRRPLTRTIESRNRRGPREKDRILLRARFVAFCCGAAT